MTYTSPRKAYHHGDLRRALLTEARALLAETGPADLTLRAVATRAGVSPAAPYRHFADKETLLAAVAEQGFTELADRAAQVREGRTGIAMLHAQGQAYLEFAMTESALYRLMFGAHVPDAERHPGLVAARERLLEQAHIGLRAARDDGAIADLPLDDVTIAMRSLMHGLALLVGDGLAPGADARTLAERIMSVVDVGLLPR